MQTSWCFQLINYISFPAISDVIKTINLEHFSNREHAVSLSHLQELRPSGHLQNTCMHQIFEKRTSNGPATDQERPKTSARARDCQRIFPAKRSITTCSAETGRRGGARLVERFQVTSTSSFVPKHVLLLGHRRRVVLPLTGSGGAEAKAAGVESDQEVGPHRTNRTPSVKRHFWGWGGEKGEG